MKTLDNNYLRREFKEALSTADGGRLRWLRKAVFDQTVNIAKMGSYNIGNEYIEIENSFEVDANTIFYDHQFTTNTQRLSNPSKIDVKNQDCLLAAKEMLDQGLKPAVLNMASRQNPGGGVANGAGAQEENLFRRTNLFQSLYRFAQFGQDYGIKPSRHQYPLDRNWGGVYSRQACVFRGAESDGYPLIENPYYLDFIAVPAVNRPELDAKNRIVPYLAEATKNKMRTILRIALANGNDSLVLGAMGCGAFCNPPAHVAELFHDVLEEDEFKDRFVKIIFAIIDDHNAHRSHNPQGNYLPFFKEFSKP